jgi:glyceraldehyde-3-phosphate dehydrogenase/erythrose-4-phosphate dehydrogenase
MHIDRQSSTREFVEMPSRLASNALAEWAALPPALKGKFDGVAVRVPIENATLADRTASLQGDRANDSRRSYSEGIVQENPVPHRF